MLHPPPVSPLPAVPQVQVRISDRVQPQRLPNKIGVCSLVRHALCVVCWEDAPLPVGQHPAMVEGALQAAAHLDSLAAPGDHREGYSAQSALGALLVGPHPDGAGRALGSRKSTAHLVGCAAVAAIQDREEKAERKVLPKGMNVGLY